jgi:hypothetical protein
MGIGKTLFILIMASTMLSGCSTFTEKAKCVKACEERYRASKDVYGEVVYKDRCKREFGPDDNEPSEPEK